MKKELHKNSAKVTQTACVSLIIACLLVSLNTVFAHGKIPSSQGNNLKPVHPSVSFPRRFNPHEGLTTKQQEITARTSPSQPAHQIRYKDNQITLQPSQHLQTSGGVPGFRLLPVGSDNLYRRPDKKPRDHNFTEPPRIVTPNPSPTPPQDRTQPPGAKLPPPGQDRRDNTKPMLPITRRDRWDDRDPTEIDENQFKRTLEITKAIRVNLGQNWYYERPICRDGYYYYSSLDRTKPFRYAYWVFDRYDHKICRKSIYFYYGRLPYILVTRVYILPYVVVSYIDTPVVILNDHYLARRIDLLLQNALAEIRDGWLYQKSYLITSHVRGGTQIAVFLDGKYEYSIDADDYVEMTADAVSEIDTISFTWQTIKKRIDGAYTAFARHVYRDSSGTTKTIYVSYTLRIVGNHSYIEEVGASRAPLG